MAVKKGSQNARILHALGVEGKWVSVSEIHRKAGNCRLNSRVSELRKKHGYTIEHQELHTKARATLRHQYRLVDPLLPLPDPGPTPERDPLDRDATPRDMTRRFRIYIVDERNNLELMATAPTEEQVGVEICRLGRSGRVARACVGILDSHGVDNDKEKGDWIVNPWDAKII